MHPEEGDGGGAQRFAGPGAGKALVPPHAPLLLKKCVANVAE
jgi:hypothetical protein